MLDWNVVVNLHKHSFSRTYLLLEKIGKVYQSDFENVLLMKVKSIAQFLKAFNAKVEADPSLLRFISKIAPVTATFSFQSSPEFEAKAKEIVLKWLPILAGKNFHVTMNRLGFKDLISSHHEEYFLDQFILDELDKIGESGKIRYENPDAIVDVETVSQQAGLSCWTREDLQKYPWLQLD